MPVRKLYVQYIPTYLKSMDVCTVQITPATAPVFLTKLKPEKQSMRKRRIKIKKLTTKQFRAMQNTIEHDCCNYFGERCVLYDDGDYPLCIQHGLRYLVCPYFRDVVIHNNADLMAELLGIPQNAKQCRECGKFFLPKHRNSTQTISKIQGSEKGKPSRLLRKKCLRCNSFFFKTRTPGIVSRFSGIGTN